MDSSLLVALEFGVVLGLLLLLAIVEVISLRRAKDRAGKAEPTDDGDAPST